MEKIVLQDPVPDSVESDRERSCILMEWIFSLASHQRSDILGPYLETKAALTPRGVSAASTGLEPKQMAQVQLRTLHLGCGLCSSLLSQELFWTAW